MPALPVLTRALTMMKEPRWGQGLTVLAGLPAVAGPENVSLASLLPSVQFGV